MAKAWDEGGKLVDAIDDIVDALPAALWTRYFGTAATGREPCPFLENVLAALHAQGGPDKTTLAAMCEDFGMPSAVLWRMGNAFSVQLAAISRLAEDYRTHPSAKTRLAYAEANCDLSMLSSIFKSALMAPGTYLAVAGYIVMEAEKDAAPTPGEIIRTLPSEIAALIWGGWKLRHAQQVFHDLKDCPADLRYDMLNAAQGYEHCILPNYALALMEKAGINLTELHARLEENGAFSTEIWEKTALLDCISPDTGDILRQQVAAVLEACEEQARREIGTKGDILFKTPMKDQPYAETLAKMPALEEGKTPAASRAPVVRA